MGLCKSKDQGNLRPDFTANSPAKLEIFPQDGILKRIDFYWRGDHTTLITAGGQIDGESNIFANLRVTIPRRGLPPIIWNPLMRDLKFITQLFEGQAPAFANPLADAGVHFGKTSIFIAPPDNLVRNPNEHGLDTRDLSGPILVEVDYGAVTSIGPSATVITNLVTVSTCVEKRRGASGPLFAWAAQSNRITHDSAGMLGPTPVHHGNIEALYGIFLRQHDVSAVSAQRVDGLITRFKLEHSQEGVLSDDFFIVEKKRTGATFQLAAADLPAGIAMPVYAPGGDVGDMPVLVGGRQLTVIHDSAETVPVEVTDVTPATGDAFYAIPIGVQFTAAGLNALRSRSRAVRSRR